MVMIAVEHDLDEVSFDGLITACQLRLDTTRIAVVQAHADVHGIIINENARLRSLRGRLPFARIVLDELRHRLRGLPCCFVQLAVDSHRSRAARGNDSWCLVMRTNSGWVCGSLARESGRSERNECGKKAEA